MTDTKRRGPGRKPKAKTQTSANQKTLLDHFPQAKRAKADEVTQNVLASDVLLSHDLLSEPLAPTPPSTPDAPNDDNRDTLFNSVATFADQSNLPCAVGEVHGTTHRVDKPPPKKVFPIFERRITRSATLASGNATPPIEASAVGPEPKPIADKLTIPTKPNTSRGPRTLQPTSSFPFPSSSKQMLDMTSDGGSQSTPIVIDLSPIRPSPEQPPHRISRGFSRTPNYADLPRSRKSRRSDTSLYPPLPDVNSQHIRGDQNTFVASSVPLFWQQGKAKERVSAYHSPPASGLFSWRTLLSPQNLPSNPRSFHAPLRKPSAPAPNHRDSQPAVSRFFDSSPRPTTAETDTSQQYWNERWRPCRADQVMGNERNACYLRDWMHALRLHFAQPSGTSNASQPNSSQPTGLRKAGSQSKMNGKRKVRKGPTIIREVKRARKRLRRTNDLDGFLASEDESTAGEESTGIDSEGDEFIDPVTDSHESTSHAAEDPLRSAPFTFGNKICNTILLTGPPGSGKTASVYACAEELGWSVFEVYPGMGKRGGAHLDGLIGDVGKNHTLPQPMGVNAQSARTPVKKDAFYAFWGGGNKADSRFHDADAHQDGAEVPYPGADVVPDCTSVEGGPTDKGLAQSEIAPTQSVILFEEVDVLFGDDAGFWNGAIAFIKECRRPVVMTCNDISTVPAADLPLQEIVKFRHPSRALVASSLQSLCLAEGLDVACDPFLRGCTGGTQANGADLPADAESPLDVRQCINQLQLGLPIRTDAAPSVFVDMLAGIDEVKSDTVLDESSSPRAAGSNSHPRLGWLCEAEEKTACASFLDAHLIRCPLSRYELSEGHSDAEVGYRAVRTVPRLISPVVPELYAEHYKMASTVATHAGATVVEDDGTELGSEWNAVDDSGEVYNRVREALDGQVLETALALDKCALTLDYAPWIRQIGHIEEQDMEEEKRKRVTRGRQTQNSQGGRAGRERTVRKWEELKGTTLGGT